MADDDVKFGGGLNQSNVLLPRRLDYTASPAVVRRLNEKREGHEIEIENLQLQENLMEQRQTWRSCCLQMDRRAVIHFSQLFVSALLLAFCISQLVLHPDPQQSHSSTYFLLIGLICGFHLGVYGSAQYNNIPAPYTLSQQQQQHRASLD